MRFIELNPRWARFGGPGVTYHGAEVAERIGVGVIFDCPCGEKDNTVFIPFTNPTDGGPNLHAPRGWERIGDTLENLTLRPSIQRVGGCAWHGFITNGWVIKC
jgi:hypothetical protein